MKKITVIWTDAVIYGRHSSEVNQLPQMQTSGFLYREGDDYVVIKKPKTNKLKAKWRFLNSIQSLLGKKPTYLYLPKRMIDKIDDH